MMNTIRSLAGSLAAVALLAACSIVGPDGRERLGIIWPLPEPPQVVVPQTAQAGQPFTVTVVTQGGGCLRPGPTRVRTRGMTAEVRPYDVHNGGRVCTTDVAPYEHTATLRFDQPGTATVEFHGRGSPDEVVITRTVTITGG